MFRGIKYSSHSGQLVHVYYSSNWVIPYKKDFLNTGMKDAKDAKYDMRSMRQSSAIICIKSSKSPGAESRESHAGRISVGSKKRLGSLKSDGGKCKGHVKPRECCQNLIEKSVKLTAVDWIDNPLRGCLY